MAEWDLLDLLGAVIFIVILAPITLQTTVNLCSHSNPLSNFKLGHFISYMGDLSDNFVSWYDPFVLQFSPTSSDGMDV